MPRKKIGQIAKAKAFLQPEIDKRIVCNKLVFVETKKFKNDEKKLFLVFEAYNNELNERQRVTYQPKTGLLEIIVSHGFVFPQMKIVRETTVVKRATRMYEGSTIVKDAKNKMWTIVTMQRRRNALISYAKKVISYEDGKVQHDLNFKPVELINTTNNANQINVKRQQKKALELFESQSN